MRELLIFREFVFFVKGVIHSFLKKMQYLIKNVKDVDRL